jgi:hypothetical protein
MDPAVKSRIEALRNSGKIVHLYVDRIEVEE